MPPAAPSVIISHWYHLIENFQASPKDYYTAVEAAIQQRQIPEAGTTSVDWKEGGMFSAKREYLRVTRDKLVFDICGAPFGNGFFFSWWLGELKGANLFQMIAVVFGLFIVGLLAVAVLSAISTAIFGSFLGLLLTIAGIPLVFLLIGILIRENPVGIEDTILEIPVLGFIYGWLFRPATYYKTDTALMFQEMVHAAVLEVIDQMMGAKGKRALSELERKPIMKEFYRK